MTNVINAKQFAFLLFSKFFLSIPHSRSYIRGWYWWGREARGWIYTNGLYKRKGRLFFSCSFTFSFFLSISFLALNLMPCHIGECWVDNLRFYVQTKALKWVECSQRLLIICFVFWKFKGGTGRGLGQKALIAHRMSNQCIVPWTTMVKPRKWQQEL